MSRKSESPKAQKTGMSRRQLLLGWREAWKEDAAEQQAAQQEQDAHSKQQEQLLRQAREAFGSGDTSGAMALYRSYVKANPDETAPRRELGVCLYELGQYIQARVEFERLVRGDAPDAVSLLYLGLCLLHMNRPAKALQSWQRFMPANEADEQLQTLLQQQCELLQAEAETHPEGPVVQKIVANMAPAAQQRFAAEYAA